jgi:hypothetical protein
MLILSIPRLHFGRLAALFFGRSPMFPMPAPLFVGVSFRAITLTPPASRIFPTAFWIFMVVLVAFLVPTGPAFIAPIFRVMLGWPPDEVF